ncbi:MAG: SH3 domain-containing protein [Acidobacteria bacterium]|nr:SH3 domain-containing protein [Acidobacteriota bacterium]
MRLPFLTTLLLITAISQSSISAQTKKPLPAKPKATTTKSAEVGQNAVVIDETISVLRKNPSLFSDSVHRMQRGRKVQILGVTEADGVKFYKVTAPPKNFGWVQSDAVFGRFRPNDEERLARLVQAADGFEQLEIATEFFALYPNSRFRPATLLLFGDLLEEAAAKLSKDATSRLSRKEMAASGAPLHSYYLNFNMLDRYRKLDKTATTPEVIEAQKRLDSLKQKMEKTAAK